MRVMVDMISNEFKCLNNKFIKVGCLYISGDFTVSDINKVSENEYSVCIRLYNINDRVMSNNGSRAYLTYIAKGKEFRINFSNDIYPEFNEISNVNNILMYKNINEKHYTIYRNFTRRIFIRKITLCKLKYLSRNCKINYLIE